KSTASLRHFFPSKFSGKLLLLPLAQDSKRHFRSVWKGLQQLSQLARLKQNLVVQHFEDVVLLNAGSRSGTVRLDIIDNQPEAFRQAKLITHDCWYLRCVHTEIRDGNLRTVLMMTWHSRPTRRTRRLWRLRRRRRWVRECCDRQQRDDCDGEYGFHFYWLLFLIIELKLESARFPRWDRRRGGMHPFPDCANARFVVCCSERAVAVVLSHRQNATLHCGRYKRGSCRRQERTCWERLIARPRAEPVVF